MAAIIQRKNSSSSQEKTLGASIMEKVWCILTKEEKLSIGCKLYTVKTQTECLSEL